MYKKFLTPQNILIALSSIVIIIAVLLFLKYQSTQLELNKLKSDPRLTNEILVEIGKLIFLPDNETPTIATVTEVEKLRINQPFFNSAKNGDKIIVYTKKAILYDPVAKKIIDVTAINPGSPSAQTQSSSPTPNVSYKFTILNGTPTSGLGLKYENILKKLIPNAVVVDKDFAKKNSYPKTILVDISKKYSDEASQISQTLNVPLESLPGDETKPTNTDFLIILGSDKESL